MCALIYFSRETEVTAQQCSKTEGNSQEIAHSLHLSANWNGTDKSLGGKTQSSSSCVEA